MKDKLIAAGVKNLRDFGYANCNDKNILTDYIYASFFMRMLQDNKGRSKLVDKAIDELLAECQKTVAKGIPEIKRDKKGKK